MRLLLTYLLTFTFGILATANEDGSQEQSYADFTTPDLAETACRGPLKSLYFWTSNCVELIEGHTLDSDVLRLASRRARLDPEEARLIVKAGLDQSFQPGILDYIFNNLAGGFTGKSQHTFVAVAGDAEFDLAYLEMCQSRTVIASLLNPIGSSRTLNLDKILSCVSNFRNFVDVGVLTGAKVRSCKLKATLVARNSCVQVYTSKWRNEDDKQDLLERLQDHLPGNADVMLQEPTPVVD